jgi:ABC-type bacteriocin/lantibiotic exporter with double-glycine peptidase domain
MSARSRLPARSRSIAGRAAVPRASFAPALRAGLGIAAALLAVGCRPARWMPAASIAAELSPSAVILEVPEVRQQDRSDCGVAALAALLRYHGRELDAEALRRFRPEAIEPAGARAGDLRDYLRDRGFFAVLVHGSLDRREPAGLLAMLDRGLPVIAELVSRDGETRRHHFALVIGYAPEERWIFIMDPDRGAGALSFESFAALWTEAESLLLVAVPEDVAAR